MNKQQVLKYLGYNNQLIDNEMNALIDECINKVDQLKGHTQYRTFDFTMKDSIIVNDTIIAFKSRSISHLLNQAEKVVFFAATLGPAMDQLILKAGYESKLKQMILDACASVKIDEIIDQMVMTLEGYKTPRFSPGYGDLDLSIQRDLIQVIQANKIGITITDSYVMLPKKSVTGLFGISKNEMTVNYLFCDDCLLRTSCDQKICKRE